MYDNNCCTETEVTCLQFSPTGDDLVLGMSNGNVVILDGESDNFVVKHILDIFDTKVLLVICLKI